MSLFTVIYLSNEIIKSEPIKESQNKPQPIEQAEFFQIEWEDKETPMDDYRLIYRGNQLIVDPQGHLEEVK